jgi:hypothetical protein
VRPHPWPSPPSLLGTPPERWCLPYPGRRRGALTPCYTLAEDRITGVTVEGTLRRSVFPLGAISVSAVWQTEAWYVVAIYGALMSVFLSALLVPGPGEA